VLALSRRFLGEPTKLAHSVSPRNG
jgi:hypothetical protein